jgi:hypothetical protein
VPTPARVQLSTTVKLIAVYVTLTVHESCSPYPSTSRKDEGLAARLRLVVLRKVERRQYSSLLNRFFDCALTLSCCGEYEKVL